jgi:hypothetical protein
MVQKPKQLREKDEKKRERLDSLISRRFSASNMSSSKWVKLLRCAAQIADKVPKMNYKLVNEEEIHYSYNEEVAEAIDEVWFREPIIYKELEWVEFPYEYQIDRGEGLEPIIKKQGIEDLKSLLEKNGNFPISLTKTGLRINGYVKA